MEFLVPVDWLHDHLDDPNIRIFDCRFHLQSPRLGLQQYMEEHIPGAIYVDLEKDLSGRVQEHGGRHPLPPIDEFVEKLQSVGVTNDTLVVVYDDQDSTMAARCVWFLHYIGHRKVLILNGGFTAWKNKGLPTEQNVPTFQKSEYIPTITEQMLASVDEVRLKKDKSETILIDSREKARFLGEQEPIDVKKGHIPGAVNYFWKGVIGENSHWKTEQEVKDHFKDIPKDSEIIVYCGSGVSACPNILALQQIGYTNVKLYVGSWSDWISYPEHEIALGE